MTKIIEDATKDGDNDTIKNRNMKIRSVKEDIANIHTYCYSVLNSREIEKRIIQEIIRYTPSSLNPSPLGIYEQLSLEDRAMVDNMMEYDRLSGVDICIFIEPDLELMQNIEMSLERVREVIV